MVCIVSVVCVLVYGQTQTIIIHSNTLQIHDDLQNDVVRVFKLSVKLRTSLGCLQVFFCSLLSHSSNYENTFQYLSTIVYSAPQK